MIRFAVDEDFDNNIVRGLQRIIPEVDVVRSIDVGLTGKPDPVALEWAARDVRVMLTHDGRTMADYAWERIGRGLDMPGCIVVHKPYQMGVVIQRIAEIYEDNDELLAQRVIRLSSR